MNPLHRMPIVRTTLALACLTFPLALIAAACGLPDLPAVARGGDEGDGTIADGSTSDGSIDDGSIDGGSIDGGAMDGSPNSDASDSGTTPDAACDLSQPFGAPVNLSELNTSTDEQDQTLTADGRTIYFTRGVSPQRQIFVAGRSAPTGPFGAATALNLNIPGHDFICPFVTPAGGSLYFSTILPEGGVGSFDIVVASPPSAGSFTLVPSVNSPTLDYGAVVLPDTSAMFLSTLREGGPGATPIWVAPITSGNFGVPAAVATINGASTDERAKLSADARTMYFASSRAGSADIFIATRANPSGSFGTATPVSELNTADQDKPGWISPDGCTIYFYSDHAYPGSKGGLDLYRATKP